MFYYFAVWYLIGFVSFLTEEWIVEEQITVNNILHGMLFGFGGVFTAIIAFIEAVYETGAGDRVVWKRKGK